MYPLVEAIVTKLDSVLREEFEERAGIMQYEGKLERDDAEQQALINLLQRHEGIQILTR